MERGQIIVLGGEKGGVGKSTITTNLAVYSAHKGAEVVVIDTDPQKTSINWIDRRNELIDNSGADIPKIIGVSKTGNIKDLIQDFALKYDLVIVDAAGRDSQSLRTSLVIADKFLCPIKASQADLETLPHICDIISIARDFNNQLESKVVISCAPTNPMINEVEKAKELLKDFTDYFQLVNTFIRERKVFRDGLLEGKGVIELDNKKAKEEFLLFVNEVLKLTEEV